MSLQKQAITTIKHIKRKLLVMQSARRYFTTPATWPRVPVAIMSITIEEIAIAKAICMLRFERDMRIIAWDKCDLSSMIRNLDNDVDSVRKMIVDEVKRYFVVPEILVTGTDLQIGSEKISFRTLDDILYYLDHYHCHFYVSSGYEDLEVSLPIGELEDPKDIYNKLSDLRIHIYTGIISEKQYINALEKSGILLWYKQQVEDIGDYVNNMKIVRTARDIDQINELNNYADDWQYDRNQPDELNEEFF